MAGNIDILPATRVVDILPATRAIEIDDARGTRTAEVAARVVEIVEAGRTVITITDTELPDLTLIFDNQLI